MGLPDFKKKKNTSLEKVLLQYLINLFGNLSYSFLLSLGSEALQTTFVISSLADYFRNQEDFWGESLTQTAFALSSPSNRLPDY